MNVTIKPYVEMKKSAKILKGLTSAIVKTDLVWRVMFAKVKKDVPPKKINVSELLVYNDAMVFFCSM